jgi:ABC-type multidrug transport system fused ATPase/permease subunit
MKFDELNLKKNLLKIQMEIDYTNFSANKAFYKILKYFSGLIFFLVVIFCINFINEKIAISRLIIFGIFFISSLTSFYFEKKIILTKERVKSKIENDLISANYEVSDFINIKNNQLIKNQELLEKKIENEIKIFKDKSQKTIFFCNSEYIFYIVQFFYFFIGFIAIFYIGEKESLINSFLIFYLLICGLFYYNFTKFLNLFFNKVTLYFLIQNNIINYNTLDEKKDQSSQENNEANSLYSKELYNLQNEKNDEKEIEENVNEIEKLIHTDQYKNSQILIKLIEFKGTSFTHPEFKIKNNENYESKNAYLNYVDLTIKEKSSTIIISNDNSNIELFRFLKKFNFKINSGQILINNKNISDFPDELIEDSFFVVDCYEINYDLTIKENIVNLNPEISDELLFKAFKITGIFDFINSLPLLHHSLVSKNQIDDIKKFQISLTKCFLNDAQVIIFNFLNIEDEKNEIIEKIKSICLEVLKERIMIFLTNDSFGLENGGQIVLFENNQIKAIGSHEELTRDENKSYLRFLLRNSGASLSDETYEEE